MRAIEIKSKDVRSHYYVNSGLRERERKVVIASTYIGWKGISIHQILMQNYKGDSYFIHLLHEIVERTPIYYLVTR